jgi:XTP/dITP diphosphohydrolase
VTAETRRSPLVVATSNRGKLREIRSILSGLSLTLQSLEEFPQLELPEEGDDYEANAVAKARAVASATRLAALADDSGLEVEALGGAPGPHSARYGGPALDDAGRVARLLDALRKVPPPARRARFVCVAALAEPDGQVVTTRGECHGRILEAARGGGGFGYDPVFLPDGEARSMAELPPQRKNAISHRARAFQALAERLRARSSSRSG